MIKAVADTHTVIWYIYADARLSRAALAMIETAAEAGDQVAVSSITLAEMVYLSERGRIRAEALGDERVVFSEVPLDSTVVRAMAAVPRDDVPDLPDRIIAATAVRLQVPIISRDGAIRSSRLQTVW